MKMKKIRLVDSILADARLSTSGYVFKLARAPISWQAKKQACVTLSSMEAEYVAQALAVQELKWLQLLLTELAIEKLFTKPTAIYADNKGAIALASNPEHHPRSKHIDIRYHYQRQEVEAGTCEFRYIPTADQAADGLTKPLARVAFQRFVQQLGLCKV